MAKRQNKAPVPVLVVDTTYGITGLRKSGGTHKLPGGMVVLPISAFQQEIPEGLIPSEIHVAEGDLTSPLQDEWREVLVDALLERQGELDHAHRPEHSIRQGEGPETVFVQVCRCGAERSRGTSPSDWSEWS